MPDIAVPYTLTTPAGAIVFNDGSASQFYIQNITGLVGTTLRTPIDDIAYGDGSFGHNFWKSGRHISIEGLFLVDSLICGPALVTVWNSMEETLRAALESIAALTTDTATLVWTALGQPERTLTVRHDVPLECPPDQNFLVRNFTFGLFAEDPDWVETP